MIGSRLKRSSLIGYCLHFGRILPFPDGEVTRGDRLQLAGLYRFSDQWSLQATALSVSTTGGLAIGLLYRLTTGLPTLVSVAGGINLSVQRALVATLTVEAESSTVALGLWRKLVVGLLGQSATPDDAPFLVNRALTFTRTATTVASPARFLTQIRLTSNPLALVVGGGGVLACLRLFTAAEGAVRVELPETCDLWVLRACWAVCLVRSTLSNRILLAGVKGPQGPVHILFHTR